ncbi:hypothetical protein ALC60_01962, partial [Trachymyrmex zeteki]
LHIMRSCSPGIWPALVRANKYPKARNREAWRGKVSQGWSDELQKRGALKFGGPALFTYLEKNPLSTPRRATRHLDRRVDLGLAGNECLLGQDPLTDLRRLETDRYALV